MVECERNTYGSILVLSRVYVAKKAPLTLQVTIAFIGSKVLSAKMTAHDTLEAVELIGAQEQCGPEPVRLNFNKNNKCNYFML